MNAIVFGERMKTKVVEYISRIQDGGAETIVKDYALKLDKAKFDVIVMCEDYKRNSANYRTLVDNNVKIVSTYNNFDYLCRGFARIFGNAFISFLFSRTIKLIKPDIIHVHLESLDVVYRSRKNIEDVKLFFTCHNLPELKIGEKNHIEKNACEYLLKNNNLQIFALHENMAKEIDNMFGINTTKVMKNGIDFNNFVNISKTKGEIRKGLNISDDDYVVGNIGRFHYQKNHEFIINIFNRILQKNVNSHLLLVGDGKLKKDIVKLIKELGIIDKVTIVSNRNDIPELFKAMDVFLFPSRYEGLGIVLIESQTSGVHCVVSDAVPNEAFRSNLISKLSLNDSIDVWANMCMEPKCNIKEYGNLQDYNIDIVIKKLENYYLS